MRPVEIYRWKAFRALVVSSLCLSFVRCGGHGGFLGLEDYQRDVLSVVGGGLAGALLSNMVAELGLPGDQAGQPAPGAPGPQGPPGPTFFSVYIDQFFGAQFDDGFEIVPVPEDAPTLSADAGPVGYRLVVPSTYDANNAAVPGADQQARSEPNPITMRLFLYRRGECNGGCFVFTVDARRLQAGDSGPQCYGGTAADCSDGTRWVQVDRVCSDGDGEVSLYFVVDLPLMAGGLEYPEIFAGDYLAFELNGVFDDGGSYRLFGVEFFESAEAQLVNATVFPAEDSLPEDCDTSDVEPLPGPDCNGNGVPDPDDIADGANQDCNGNGVPDECDIADGSSNDTNGNGIPDECEDDCNGNGIPDDQDIADETSQDCNHNDVPDECDIDPTDPDANGQVSADCQPDGIPDECQLANNDCNNNRIPDECDIADGASNDLNANGIPDECEPDCNGNGIPDDWDIAQGNSNDVNGNGIPDECENDCNGNGIPDDQDIADGTSEDCNDNDIPDECDVDPNDPDGNGEVSADCQPDGIPDECQLQDNDCNENEVPDECDIADGASNDVNGNGIPDECEADCNGNGIPDDWDIDQGTSQDCQPNGIPDECDVDPNDPDGDGQVSADANGNGIPDECELGESCCDYGKPRVLTMLYTGADCSATSHWQDPANVNCDDFGPLPATVFIVASNQPVDGGNPLFWFEGTVNLGETFDVDAANAGRTRLKGTTHIHIFDSEGGTLLQTVQFHTSCSAPLVRGDQYGASLLVDCIGEDEGSFCVDAAKPQVLTMRYTGEDCSASDHSQDPSKVSCDGDPMFEPVVRIRASDKSNPNHGHASVWFDGTVELDSTFDIDATNAGETKLKANTWVHVFDANDVLLQTIRFHTSCSQPLYPDDQFGSLVLIEFIPE